MQSGPQEVPGKSPGWGPKGTAVEANRIWDAAGRDAVGTGSDPTQ